VSEGRQEVIYLEVDGLRRRYVLYRPHAVVTSGQLAPLVIMLDGRGGTPWTAMKITRWNDTADRHGFVVVYPEATRVDPKGPLHFLTNPQMWNAGAGGSDTERPEVDDLTFLRSMVDHVVLHARIDRTRIYLTGFSNGAAMTYRFALAFPETLAAIAPVAGHLRQYDQVLAAPVPMLALFGRLDPLSPYEGGPVDLPWGVREVRPPAPASVHAWAALNGHDPAEGRITTEPGLSRLAYGEPGARDEVVFITIDDLGHVWPGGHRLLPEPLRGRPSHRLDANAAIWTFFQRHQR